SSLPWSLRVLQLFPPPVRFGLVVLGVVELHQPLQGLDQAAPGVLWYPGLALFNPPVALLQQRPGVGVFLLAQQRGAAQGSGVERGPQVGLMLGAYLQAVAGQPLGLGVLPLRQ